MLDGDLKIATRFWNKVNLRGPVPDYRPDLGRCWVWTDRPEANGYGRFHVRYQDGRPIRKMAHVFAYERANGPVSAGLHLDHLCRVRLCVNPLHLEAVTPQENFRRGFAAQLNRDNHQVAKTHCPKGHPYDEDNTYIDRRGHRRCRACNRERMAASR